MKPQHIAPTGARDNAIHIAIIGELRARIFGPLGVLEAAQQADKPEPPNSADASDVFLYDLLATLHTFWHYVGPGAFNCAARKTFYTDWYADCDWPTCMCDPYANRVIAALQESGDLREKADQRYPCLSTLDGPPRCMYCGRPWVEIVHMLKKYKRWERRPDCPKRAAVTESAK